MEKKVITRRDFLKVASMTPLAGAFLPGLLTGQDTERPNKSKVVLIRDKDVLDPSGKQNPDIIQRMLDDAVTTLLGEKDPVNAWKMLVKSTDTVGIKTNVWNYLPTGAAIEQALKRRVMDAGVAEARISLDDRGVLRNLIFKEATALINARPARSHHWSGMGGCIKNYIMFVPSPSDYHGDACADLAKIWDLPLVKNKTRLNVLVMLTPLFHGIGPHHFSKEYTWPYKGLIVGKDPVAVDTVGVQILQAQRQRYFGEQKPMQTSPHHITLAATRHHLGHTSPEHIELTRLGWQEDLLI